LSATTVHIQTFDNGFTLVAEEMEHVQSAAFNLVLPAGAATDPEGQEGSATVLQGLVYRGAGERTSRELSDALDALGVQRGGGAALEHVSFSGALLGEDLGRALALHADIVRRPHLPEEEFPAEQALALQELASLDDNPAQKLFVKLTRAFFPGPHGRNPLGTQEGLENLTIESIRADYARRYRPDGAILAVAGRLDWETLRAQVEDLFGDWEGSGPRQPQPSIQDRPTYVHYAQATAQEHIGVAYPEVTVEEPTYYDAQMAVQVLSGGTSSRLFMEVREKRGLVYAVTARSQVIRDLGFVLCYAGTTPDRSQETLDVLLEELRRLPEGVTAEEVERARTGLLSALVMMGESTPARAGAIANDFYLRGRVRSLDEIRAALEKVTPESIQAHLKAHPPQDFTIVTLGPTSLKL